MSLNSLKELFVEQINDLYSAEKMLLEALPKMVDAASEKELKQAFKTHLKETRQQISRLEKVFKEVDESIEDKECAAMKGLLEEGDEVMQEQGEPAVKDAALIAAAQRIEHYEMAGYGSARTFAQHLNLRQAPDLLQQTLEEEAAADEKLTEVAEELVNPAAEAEGEETEVHATAGRRQNGGSKRRSH